MKPLDFTLEEMRDLIASATSSRGRAWPRHDAPSSPSGWRTYRALVEHQLERLRERVDSAEAFARQLGDELD